MQFVYNVTTTLDFLEDYSKIEKDTISIFTTKTQRHKDKDTN